MSMAFTFATLSPALTSFRDQMSESYSVCSWQPVARPSSRPLHSGLGRSPRAAHIHPVEPRAARFVRGDCLDRTDQIAAAIPKDPCAFTRQASGSSTRPTPRRCHGASAWPTC